MRVIGIIGNMGSGKTTVSRMLRELGATVLDADKVGHELLTPHTEAWQEIVATFGQDILTPSGEVDRPQLGRVVFNDPQALDRLNKIMWPRLVTLAQQKIKELRQQGARVVAVEAAVAVEANWLHLMEEVWMTVASEDTVVQRLLASGRFTEEEARSRLRSQMPVEEKAKYAQVIIDTDCDLKELRRRVEETWRQQGLDKESPAV